MTNRNIENIINELLREDVRKEATEILTKCSDERYNEFMDYYNDKSKHNVCCLVLDFAKKELVEKGQMEQNLSDDFGILW